LYSNTFVIVYRSLEEFILKIFLYRFLVHKIKTVWGFFVKKKNFGTNLNLHIFLLGDKMYSLQISRTTKTKLDQT